MVILFFAATGGFDFSPLSSMPITFPVNSSDGEEICVSLDTFLDDEIEGDENFTIVLALSTPGSCLLNLGQDSTVIFLTDSNGMMLTLNLPPS